MRILLGILISLIIVLLIAVSGYLGYYYGDDLGYTGGWNEGYAAGCIQGAGTGYTLRNPTYQEAMDFTATDRTDEHEYQEEIYTCSDFATDFNNNAEENGLRCAYIYIEYTSDLGHSITGFDTVDRGIIFIEPQFDKVVTLEEGMHYSEENGFKEPDYEDIVRRFTIAW